VPAEPGARVSDLRRRVLRGAPSVFVAAALFVVAPMFLAGCGGDQPDRWESLGELRATDLGGGRSAPAAGVSTRILNPPRPLDMEDYAAEHGGATFRIFMNKCGACHAAPDPALRTASGWEPLLARMEAHIAAAGLLPPRAEERDSIRAFLRRHAQPAPADSAVLRP